jgi:hypothetical protein
LCNIPHLQLKVGEIKGGVLERYVMHEQQNTVLTESRMKMLKKINYHRESRKRPYEERQAERGQNIGYRYKRSVCSSGKCSGLNASAMPSH